MGIRIKDIPAVTTLTASDVFALDGANGAKGIKVSNLAPEIVGKAFANAGYHNSIFRGKNLGTSLTDAQSSAIKAGTFDNLFVGDYWVINGVNWRIAGFDIFLNTGDTSLTAHHVVVVPDTNLYSQKMNETNTTEGGYYNSVMRQSGLDSALEKARSAFGTDRVIKRRALLTNTTSSGKPSGWSWYDSYIELMTEAQVYGQYNWGQHTENGYESGVDYSRLPLFTLAPQYVCNRSWYWLRTIHSSTNFCNVFSHGRADNSGASLAGGVRPLFLIA